MLSTLGAADALVGELGNDLPAVPLSYRLQFAQLILHRLPPGTDPGIDCGASDFGFHGRPPDRLDPHIWLIHTENNCIRYEVEDAGQALRNKGFSARGKGGLRYGRLGRRFLWDSVSLDPTALMICVDADSSQAIVVEEARDRRNLVVQGPPGTGKSQTITNIIAVALRRLDRGAL